MKRRLLVLGLVALGLLGAITVRVVLSSRAAYVSARSAEAKGLAAADPTARARALEDAIVRYRRAARWYAPGNGYVGRSLRALSRIARLAEMQGDRRLALMAYRAIRRAILGARSFYTPNAELLDPANRNIARLSALVQGGRRASSADLARLQAWHLAQLRRSNAPSVGWSLLALAGFGLWVGGGFLLIFRAITPDDRLLGRRALLWGGLVAAGLLLWLLGLSRA